MDIEGEFLNLMIPSFEKFKIGENGGGGGIIAKMLHSVWPRNLNRPTKIRIS